ncbi:MAG: aldo/keto reductase [Chitinispirillaceae bacterium]
MKKRIFGNTGREVSEVGLGTWQLGGDFGEVSEEDALDLLRAAYEKGITFIDTADVYGGGKSESLVGRFLKETNAPMYVATKLGRFKGYPDQYSFDVLKSSTEDSLERLGVDRIDLTQLHCIPTRYMKSGEVFDWLRELRSEGKIASFGASVETMEEAMICLEQPDITSLQIIFNIFRQKPLEQVLEKAKQNNTAIIVRLPLASGLLAGKYTAQTTFSPGDHRTYNRDGQAFSVGETFAGIPFEKGVELAEGIRQFVPEGMTMAQFSLRWILDHDAVSVVIPGARNRKQVEGNAAASDLAPIPAGIHEKLRSFYENEVKSNIRGPY